MNAELMMIFNSDETGRSLANVNPDNEAMAALYNEFQRSIVESDGDAQMIVDDSSNNLAAENLHNQDNYKESDSTALTQEIHENPNCMSIQDSNCISVEDPNDMSIQDSNCLTNEDPSGVSVQDSNCISVEDQNCVSIQDPNCMTTEDPNCMTTEDPNCVSIQDPNYVTTEAPNCITTETSSSMMAEENPNCVSTVSTSDQTDFLPLSVGDESLSSSELVKPVTVPDNWQIPILDASGIVSHSAEPLVASEQGTYQLWECAKCTALFREKELCENHIKKAHDFSCSLCYEPFKEKSELENHIVKHIEEFHVPFISSEQKHSVSEKESAENPNSNQDNNARPVKRKKLNPERHFSIETSDDEPEYQSSESLRERFSQSSRKQNLRTANEDSGDLQEENDTSNASDFSCKICGANCFTRENLYLHVSKKHIEGPDVGNKFRCHMCNKLFTSKAKLEHHREYMHHSVKRDLQKFQCPICKKSFGTSDLLKQHVMTHDEIYPFPCDFCGQSFKHCAGLTNHIKTAHPHGKEFNCSECGKAFRSKKHLEVHVSEAHASGRKKCRYCSKTYKTFEAVLTHIQEAHVREEQKHFDCDYCSRSFSNSRKLKQHMEIHLSNIQGFECESCKLSFPTSTALRQHTETHYSPYVFDCDYCSRSFSHKENLRVHIKVHHNPGALTPKKE